MNVRHPSPPASRRARRAAATAIGAGVVSVILLAVVSRGSTDAAIAMLVSLGTVFLAMTRYLAMTELSDVGDVPVGAVALPASVLPGSMTSRDVLSQLAQRPGVDHHLVRHGAHWRVVSSSTLIQQALVTDGVIDTAELGRPAGRVEPSISVDRLPRPPFAGELVVVGDARPPRIFCRDSLFVEVPEPTNPSAESTPATHHSPKLRPAMRGVAQ